MKAKTFSFCLSASLLVHAAVFGVIVWKATLVHPPELPGDDSRVALTLVAAPAEKPVVAIVVSPPVAPATPIVKEVVKNEAQIPSETIESVPLPETPLPLPPSPVSSPVIAIHGDSSAVLPGIDSTTQTLPPGINTKPDYLKNPAPPYPSSARRHHQEGLVVLTAKVTAEGHAAEVIIKQSSGFPVLDEAALKAVRDWNFVPARIGPISVESQIEVPVLFKLVD